MRRLLHALLYALIALLVTLMLVFVIATANAQEPRCIRVTSQWEKNFCAEYTGPVRCESFNEGATTETIARFLDRAGVDYSDLIVWDSGPVWNASYLACSQL